MNKPVKIILIILAALILLTGSFSGGFIVGHFSTLGSLGTGFNLPGGPDLSSPHTTQSGTPADLQTLFAPFWETWTLVHKNYVDQPVDDTKLMQGAIRGMLDSLGDQHTSYMDPSQYAQANASISGEYSGIGAWVDPQGEFLTVVSPMPGSPAEKAGLQPGDQIIKVDGADMTGTPGELVIQKVLGPAGTEVTLTIQREGQDPFDVTVTRARIVVPSVESKMLEGDIAYVKLISFGEKSAAELKTALTDLLSKNPKGLIFDLRNNTGGLLVSAVDVASLFLPENQVVLYERYGDGKEQSYKTDGSGVATEIPLVVLVNEGSASASEIVAGAIQDYGRGQLVGVTTFGKGSVQNWSELANQQGAVRITIAKWLTPNKRAIHKIGLTPDVTVELTKEDFDAKLDPQLDKAVELLSRP